MKRHNVAVDFKL